MDFNEEGRASRKFMKPRRGFENSNLRTLRMLISIEIFHYHAQLPLHGAAILEWHLSRL